MFSSKKKKARKAFALIAPAIESIAIASGINQNGIYHLDNFIRGYLKYAKESVFGMFEIKQMIDRVMNEDIPVVDFIKNGFPQVRGWVNNIRGQLNNAIQTNPTALAQYMPLANATAVFDALIRANAVFCSMDSNYEICRQEKHIAAPIIPRRRKEIDLNKLWAEKCSSNADDPEWVDSLFCALGKGNALASFIMRMRFGVPDDPNQNIFKILYNIANNNNVILDGVSRGILDAFLAKIDRRERFKWGDLAAIVKIMKLPGVKNYIAKQLAYYGISTGVDGTTPDMRRERAKNDLYPRVDLQYLWNSLCSHPEGSAPSAWTNTLFCEMGYDEPAAMMLAAMKFTIPTSDPQNHIVIKLLNLMAQAFQAPDPQSGRQTWTNWAIEKALAWVTSDLRSKIMRNEKITWDDLNMLYNITQIPLDRIPLIGSKITQYIGSPNVSQIIEAGANNSLNPRGIEFVPPYVKDI